MSDMPYHVFFIGPRKTGTTSLYDMLAESGVLLPKGVKETFFFEQPEVNLDSYRDRYDLDPQQPFVEVSPSYFASDAARTHLRSLFPDARIVVTLRDPVSRALSAISHLKRIGMITESDVEDLHANRHVRNILAASDYKRHLALWADAFAGQILITRQTDAHEFHPEAVARINALTGLDIDLAKLRGMRSNPARVSRSPGLVRQGKKALRLLERVGLGGVRRALKPYSGWLYRPAAPQGTTRSDDALTRFLAAELEDACRYYEALPSWQQP